MRKTYLITLLLCCFSALLNGAVSPFSFSSLKMEEGLSQLSVLKIHQDKSGFMWFATRNGLNRYDGNSFVVYKHSNGDSLSLSSNHVTALAEDDRGNLWVGTMNGLNRMDLRVDRYILSTIWLLISSLPFIIRGFQACMWIDKSVFGLEQIKVYTCMIMRMIRLS